MPLYTVSEKMLWDLRLSCFSSEIFPRYSIYCWFPPDQAWLCRLNNVDFILQRSRLCLAEGARSPLSKTTCPSSPIYVSVICRIMDSYFFRGLLFISILKLQWCSSFPRLRQRELPQDSLGICMTCPPSFSCVYCEHFILFWNNKIFQAHLVPALPQLWNHPFVQEP